MRSLKKLKSLSGLVKPHMKYDPKDLMPEPQRHVIDLDEPSFKPKKWEIVSHKKGGKLIWAPSKVRLVMPHHSWSVSWHKTRLAEQPTLNANVLDYLLANPSLIPESWKGQHVIFLGTTYCARFTNTRVRYLHFNESKGRWAWASMAFGEPTSYGDWFAVCAEPRVKQSSSKKARR